MPLECDPVPDGGPTAGTEARSTDSNAKPQCRGVVYRGVIAPGHGGRWRAQIRYRRRSYHLGEFSNPHEAALAHNHAARILEGDQARLNPVSVECLPSGDRQAGIEAEVDLRLRKRGFIETTGEQVHTPPVPRVGRASGYRGVAPSNSQGHWTATVRHDSGRRCLGIFSTRHEAALAYNHAGLVLQLAYFIPNVIAPEDQPEPRRRAEIELLVEAKLRRQGLLAKVEATSAGAYRPHQVNRISGYRGVHWHRPSQRWTAVVDSNGKRYSLGYFRVLHEAALAHNYGVQFLFPGCGVLNSISPEYFPGPNRQKEIAGSVRRHLARHLPEALEQNSALPPAAPVGGANALARRDQRTAIGDVRPAAGKVKGDSSVAVPGDREGTGRTPAEPLPSIPTASEPFKSMEEQHV